MAITISGSTGVTYPDGTSQASGQQACKAWVNFDASSGTPTIIASYNVSSITDNGVGSFTTNFTSALSDANYAVTVGVSNATYIEYWNLFDQPSGSYVAPTTTAFRSTFYGQGAYRDPKAVMFSVFRQD